MAGTFVISGIGAEILSFFWVHPMAFMGFIVAGCGLLFLGIVAFLWTLLTAGREMS
jgi:hypothetical protein